MTEPLSVLAIAIVCLTTLTLGALGLRLAKGTSDFYVAGRTVTPWRNASAIGGEYLSVQNEEAEVSATGYAKEMGDDYKAREAQLYAEQCKDVDIIITTALIPGAPRRGSSPRRWSPR